MPRLTEQYRALVLDWLDQVTPRGSSGAQQFVLVKEGKWARASNVTGIRVQAVKGTSADKTAEQS